MQVSSTYRDTLYFSDGIRKIDLMIVYKDDLDPIKNQRRNTFLNNLVSEGLELELELENSEEARKVKNNLNRYFFNLLTSASKQLQVRQMSLETKWLNRNNTCHYINKNSGGSSYFIHLLLAESTRPTNLFYQNPWTMENTHQICGEIEYENAN